MIGAGGSTDVIRGTSVDDWLLAVVAILIAVTTLAALAHKPPLRQVGRFIGWVFNQLIGRPVASWYRKAFLAEVSPIVAQIVQEAVEPIRQEQVAVAVDLRAHMVAETAERNELLALVGEHVEEDRRAFAEIREWRDTADIALGNIQAAQAPHTP